MASMMSCITVLMGLTTVLCCCSGICYAYLFTTNSLQQRPVTSFLVKNSGEGFAFHQSGVNKEGFVQTLSDMCEVCSMKQFYSSMKKDNAFAPLTLLPCLQRIDRRRAILPQTSRGFILHLQRSTEVVKDSFCLVMTPQFCIQPWQPRISRFAPSFKELSFL